VGWIWVAVGAWLVLALVYAPRRRARRSVSDGNAGGGSGPAGALEGRVIDLRDEYIYIAIGLTEDKGWTTVAYVAGFVGVMHPPRGRARALFARRAPSRDVALRDLEIDLRDAPEVDLTETARW
jgi:hypothetical protein